MQAFMQWLYILQHMAGTYEAWTSVDNNSTCWTHVVYGGNAFQAWLVSASSHGHIFWGQITGPAGCS